MALFPLFTDFPGGQPIADSSPTAKHDVGTRVKARDYRYGQAEFIYLRGTPGTQLGSLVAYEQIAGSTELAVETSEGPAAIAMSDNGAAHFGWYLISGAAQLRASDLSGFVARQPVYVTGGAVSQGTVKRAPSFVGVKVAGVKVLNVGPGPFIEVQVDHPHLRADAPSPF